MDGMVELVLLSAGCEAEGWKVVLSAESAKEGALLLTCEWSASPAAL